METIVNRVSQSALLSLDIEAFLDSGERVFLDLKEGLFHGMILKERDFRQFVSDHPWLEYSRKNVGVYCSADTIIPSWAWMLVVSRLQPVANVVALGRESELEKALIDQAVDRLMATVPEQAKVVVKGCGGISERDYAYFVLTQKLIPRVHSLMYGEPCSTVPVFKRKSIEN